MPNPKMAFRRKLAMWMCAGAIVFVGYRAITVEFNGDRFFMLLALACIAAVLIDDGK